MKAKHAVEQTSEFISKHWKILSVFTLLVSSMNTIENRQANFAQAQTKLEARMEKVETEADKFNEKFDGKLTEIKILVNRIDERTLIEASRKKNH